MRVNLDHHGNVSVLRKVNCSVDKFWISNFAEFLNRYILKLLSSDKNILGYNAAREVLDEYLRPFARVLKMERGSAA